jgi:hypothetical protein
MIEGEVVEFPVEDEVVGREAKIRHRLIARCRVEPVQQDIGACWIWTKPLDRNGYGRISVNGRSCLVHRILYQLQIGSLPDGVPLRRWCGTRGCVNPLHMVLGNKEDHFWAEVDLTGDCWLWTGATTEFGYGHLRVDGNMVYAHRFAYEAVHGSVPWGMFVLHSCDTPACVRPSHLHLGTHEDNMREMKGRKRARNGALGPLPKAAPRRCLRCIRRAGAINPASV